MIVCTFPGKHGDLLWALPTVRAISESYHEKVLLVLSPYVKSLAPLLRQQDYIFNVIVDPDWQVFDTAPMSPRVPILTSHTLPPGGRHQVYHLGYEGWPGPDLARDIWKRALAQDQRRRELPVLDLERPWITPPAFSHQLPRPKICVGFTDEWFELKYGLYQLLRQRLPPGLATVVNLSTSPRWSTEALQPPMDWDTAAGWLARAQTFVGCCSALHVLACAVGTPAVIVVEPNEARWQDVFYPYGKTGRVRLLLGGDGRPTFDARHLIDTIGVTA